MLKGLKDIIIFIIFLPLIILIIIAAAIFLPLGDKEQDYD